MAATEVQQKVTTGSVGFWDGTKDGEDGYIDYSNGTSNVNIPKEYKIQTSDIRDMEKKPTLMENGYELGSFPTAANAELLKADKTPEGKAYIQGGYYAECAEIVKKITGAPVVIPYHYRVREQKKSLKDFAGQGGEGAPRPLAHIDRDPNTFPSAVKEVLGAEKTAELLSQYKHFAQTNVWRPVGAPATKWPLVFVNHEKIPEWSYEGWTGRVYSLNDPRAANRGEKTYDSICKHDERYVYHYASNLQMQEAFVFNSFHNDPKLGVPHSAFWDDNTPEDAPNRVSIEVRSLVFYN